MFTLPVFEILRFKGGSVLSGSQVAKELIFVKLQTSVRIKLSLYKKDVVNGFTVHKKWSFPWRISSVNVTKRIWSHLLKKLLMENFIFYAVLLFFQKSSFIDVWQCTAPHVSHCTSGVTVSIETGFSATKLFVYSDC